MVQLQRARRRLLRTGRGVLLEFASCASVRALARRWGDRIIHVANDARDRLGLSAVLLRPDGIVAWAGEGDGIDGLEDALQRWFTPPQDVALRPQPFEMTARP
ncbi:hypothetical protein [Bradyrhizobium cajani]|uniref:Uncharacterized protein n=1 Tax=Bradyrhizobium cajani TaxID=1928661 RepID=A0A844T904_9BRAD|nr:hypothetical protein [Bradyrhizobium cajani]MVT72909.1 hypothetical protein [Bradyrhizobium cajani]